MYQYLPDNLILLVVNIIDLGYIFTSAFLLGYKFLFLLFSVLTWQTLPWSQVQSCFAQSPLSLSLQPHYFPTWVTRGSSFLQNFGTCLHNCTASHRRSLLCRLDVGYVTACCVRFTCSLRLPALWKVGVTN
jgi:hypothetical protein